MASATTWANATAKPVLIHPFANISVSVAAKMVDLLLIPTVREF
jgi:hypothetical protein